ncbi:MAG: hypothetical protein ACE5SW_12650 [Nitrososphaeraceae archaeon]
MSTDIGSFNSDILISGASGTAIGFAIGYSIKKVMKILFRFIMVIAVLWVGSIIYLRSIHVIDVRRDSFDNLVNHTVDSVNRFVHTNTDTSICSDNMNITSSSIMFSDGSVIGQECISEIGTKGIESIFTAIGIPMTTGLGFGILLGWFKG